MTANKNFSGQPFNKRNAIQLQIKLKAPERARPRAQQDSPAEKPTNKPHAGLMDIAAPGDGRAPGRGFSTSFAVDLRRSTKKTLPMNRAENFYAVWRERCRAVGALREENSMPPEKLLQAVWQHQRLQRDQLKTADGKSVRVLHPGFVSVEGGPDFRGAVLQFENEKPVAGDVEIDLQPNGWHAHGHDVNPNFKSVILHVVWDAVGVQSRVRDCPARCPPDKLKLELQPAPISLPLKNVLDAPLAELALALENESGLPEALRGKCSAPLRELSTTQLSELLHAAAKVRFENKAKAMLARAKHSGWEAALWENLFRALGYKHNVWPMVNLAETKPRWSRDADSAFEIQARLLGVSGLLPAELTRSQKSSDTFLRRAWDCWWRDRDEFSGCTLPRSVWKFHGLRPANHPQRRLALAAHWLAAENLVEKIEGWIVAEISERRSLNRRVDKTFESKRADSEIGAPSGDYWRHSLHEIFQVERDEFWSWHWTFNSARMSKPQPLLGEARVTDLAVNVVLPWLWIRAKEGGNEKILREVERRFFAWPAAADNSVLKLARQRLLGTTSAKVLKGAAQQQGLMQIVRDFCEHSNAICADCRFPDLVNGWKQNERQKT